MSAAVKKFGRLLLMAGGEHGRRGKGDPSLASFIESFGFKSPSVAYLGAASDDDPYYYSITEKTLLASGAGSVYLESFGRGCLSRLEAADIIFISGGDVESGMANLQSCGAIPFLVDLFKRGKPFAGVSAGSIMRGKAWVRWSDPNDDSSASLFPCLGFARLICDTHDEYDDWSELKAALAISPENELGVGIPTGGSLVIEPDGALSNESGKLVHFRSSAGACVPFNAIASPVS